MYGALGSWSWPKIDQIAPFEDEYNNNYLPLVRRVPQIVGLDLFRADESGQESDIYRVGTMWFPDKDRYADASATTEWAAMFSYCNSLIERYGIEMRFAYVHKDDSLLP